MNRDSDNFVSEMLLKELGASVARAGTTAAGAEVVRQALLEAGISLAGVRIADGSGLSPLDRLTAKTLVESCASARRTRRSATRSSRRSPWPGSPEL